MNKLAIDLYRKIEMQIQGQNVIFSPLAMAVALATLESGADGETRNQIQKVIKPTSLPAGFNDSDLSILYQALQEMVLRFPFDKGHVRIANGIFYGADCSMSQNSVGALSTAFKTEVRQVPLGISDDAARTQINQWASKSTMDMIPDLLGAEAIENGTVALLASVACLKMEWDEQFDVKLTKNRVFHRSGTRGAQKVGRTPLRCFLINLLHYVSLLSGSFHESQ